MDDNIFVIYSVLLKMYVMVGKTNKLSRDLFNLIFAQPTAEWFSEL